MSVYQRAPPFYNPFQRLPFSLAAHTASATALTEALFDGRISQGVYDARILATCVISFTRVAQAPIIMTMDDTLTTILALAVRGLDNPSDPITRETAKLYLLCPQRIRERIGIPAPVSGDFVPLDQNGLKKLLTFIKGSAGGVDEFAIACEDDLAAAEDFKKLVTHALDLENEARVMRNWRPTSSSGCRRGRELWSEVESSAQNLVQAHHRNVALRSTRESHRANEQDLPVQEAPGANEKEGREPGRRT